MNLDEFTTDQLKTELLRREAEAKAKADAARSGRQDLIMQNVDAFLSFQSEHGRTSCSDENACNYARGRCIRCTLLFVKQNNYFYDDVDFEIQIKFEAKC